MPLEFIDLSSPPLSQLTVAIEKLWERKVAKKEALKMSKIDKIEFRKKKMTK